MSKDEEQEGGENMLARKVSEVRVDISKMTREERRQFIRNQTHKICDRNDKALRRLSRS